MPDAHGPTDPDALTARLESLERSVADLTGELARLRAELDGRVDSARVATTATRPPRVEKMGGTSLPHWSSDDVESAVGRYGMLALATITGLAAVGTFLGWAITQGMLGPRARVSLGLLLAMGLGVAGVRLRRRERSFGATLLGLGLATTHLCAWAAGPLLGIVPPIVSLLLATGVSIALAAFAQAENDEPLWCVGFGGAAIAPFVASPDDASALVVAIYAFIVMVGAAYTLAGRDWPIAGRVFSAVTALFVGALMAMPERDAGPLYAIALPIAVAMIGLFPAIALTRAQPAARSRLRILGLFAAAASVRAAFATRLPLPAEYVASIVGAAGVAWIFLVERAAVAPPRDLLGGWLRNTATIADWIDAGWVPLAFVLALVVAADGGRVTNGALAAASGIAVLLLVARRPAGAFRDAAAFATSLCLLAAVAIVADTARHATAVGVAALAVLLFTAHRVWPSYSWIWVGGVALVTASVAAFVLLYERAPYLYTPFATRASATAFAIAICWAIVARLAPRTPIDRTLSVPVATIAAWMWAFLWVNEELARAFSPTASILLLVTYYALASVVAVGVGRGRSIAGLRHVGLGIGLLAAGTAVQGARRLEEVWARIAAFLVTSVFLLGIAYWYRKRDEGS